VPVINPVASYRFEKSKALQAALFERVGVRYPRTVVANAAGPLLKAAADFRFPVLVKPNVGGSGALIARFDTLADLEARVDTIDLGPDGTALLQQYVEPHEGAIVRIEVLDGRPLYAIRIVRPADDFNVCPADLCATPAAAASTIVSACAMPALTITRVDPPAEVVAQAVALARAASIDIGGIEYLVGRDDGQVYFYDVNATSNFVANAPDVLGFDPFHDFADYITRRAV
jgi:carbamoylphosphate synthase large subunit